MLPKERVESLLASVRDERPFPLVYRPSWAVWSPRKEWRAAPGKDSDFEERLLADVQQAIKKREASKNNGKAALRDLVDERRRWQDGVTEHVKAARQGYVAYDIRNHRDLIIAVIAELARVLPNAEQGAFKEAIEQRLASRRIQPERVAMRRKGVELDPKLVEFVRSAEAVLEAEASVRESFQRLVETIAETRSWSWLEVEQVAAMAREVSQRFEEHVPCEPVDSFPVSVESRGEAQAAAEAWAQKRLPSTRVAVQNSEGAWIEAPRMTPPTLPFASSPWTPQEYGRDVLIASWALKGKGKPSERRASTLWVVLSPLNWRVARIGQASMIRYRPNLRR